MKNAQIEKLRKLYPKFAKSSNYLNISNLSLTPVDSAFANSIFYSTYNGKDVYQDYESLSWGLPFKILIKDSSLKSFESKLNKCINNPQEGQYYILLIIYSLYIQYFGSFMSIRKMVSSSRPEPIDDNTLVNIGLSASKTQPLKDWSNYVLMSDSDFFNLQFDEKQLVYLKATVIKVYRLIGGMYE